MEDPVQDGVASAAAPGTGKSKLETLPKEDLIKFAKKQMMLLQKAKSRCTELEKEIEEFKSKPVDGGTDDIIKVCYKFFLEMALGDDPLNFYTAFLHQAPVC